MGPAMCSTAGMAFHTPSSPARIPAPAARGELFLTAWLIQSSAAPREAPRDALRGAEPHANPDFAFPCSPVVPPAVHKPASWGKSQRGLPPPGMPSPRGSEGPHTPDTCPHLLQRPCPSRWELEWQQ